VVTAQPLARISVVGVSGAGKSTVARMAAARLGVPCIELDAIYHGPNWTEIPISELRRIVTELVADEAWVIDGNYRKVRDLIWSRATTVVWVDPSRSVVMAQVLWRSFLRAVTRQELWHGNRERIREWIDPDHPIRWAWSTYCEQRADQESLMAAHWVRLRSRRDTRRWLDSLRQRI
jgi:adenylate kinase family enzyme